MLFSCLSLVSIISLFSCDASEERKASERTSDDDSYQPDDDDKPDVTAKIGTVRLTKTACKSFEMVEDDLIECVFSLSDFTESGMVSGFALVGRRGEREEREGLKVFFGRNRVLMLRLTPYNDDLLADDTDAEPGWAPSWDDPLSLLRL